MHVDTLWQHILKPLARIWRVTGSLLVLVGYFVASPLGYAIFWAIQLIPSKDPEGRARLLQNIMRIAFGFMHRLLSAWGLLGFDPKGLIDALPMRPCVIVANHPTLTDVSAIYASIPQVSSAIKPALFHRFWAHPLLAQAAQFEGAGKDPQSLQRMITDAVDRLNRGYHVLVFPEGTRSPPDGLHPFGRSAFEVAVRAGVPVVPVVIQCTPRWLSKDHSFFRPPANKPLLSMKALPPVDPKTGGFGSRTLRKVVSAAIAAHLTGPVAEKASTQAAVTTGL